MPVDKDSKIIEAIAALREGLPALRIKLGEWFEACREQPIMIWHTPAVRYSVYVIGALVVAWVLRGAINLGAPGGPDPVPYAKTADFHVVCINTACGEHFVINRKFKFGDFPVQCPSCKQETGQSARRCFSGSCNGRWVAPHSQEGRLACPHCGESLGVVDD